MYVYMYVYIIHPAEKALLRDHASRHDIPYEVCPYPRSLSLYICSLPTYLSIYLSIRMYVYIYI